MQEHARPVSHINAAALALRVVYHRRVGTYFGARLPGVSIECAHAVSGAHAAMDPFVRYLHACSNGRMSYESIGGCNVAAPVVCNTCTHVRCMHTHIYVYVLLLQTTATVLHVGGSIDAALHCLGQCTCSIAEVTFS